MGDMRADPGTDVWALGIIFYIVLFNEYPHRGENVRKSILENDIELPE